MCIVIAEDPKVPALLRIWSEQPTDRVQRDILIGLFRYSQVQGDGSTHVWWSLVLGPLAVWWMFISDKNKVG